MLEELRAKQGDLEAETAPPRGLDQVLAENIAQPFNEELIGLAQLLPGGDDLRQTTNYLGLTAPEGSLDENIVSESMRVLGGAVLPGGILQSMGKQVAVRVPQMMQTPIQRFLASTNTPAAMAQEILASFGAGTGGMIAEDIAPGNATAKQYGQLAGGLTPMGIAATAGPAWNLAKWASGKAGDLVEKLPGLGGTVRVARDIAEGAKTATDPYYRASKEVQSRVVDPEQAAEQIDVTSPMPPSRQVGESRLLALDESLRKKVSPAEAGRIERHIDEAVEIERGRAIDVGGDTTQPRRVIENQVMKSIQEADAALNKVDPQRTEADIGDDVRAKLIDAQAEARKLEQDAWNEVGFDSPGTYKNTQAAIDEIDSATGRALADEAVPDFVRKELETALEEGATLRDIHALRTKVQTIKGQAILNRENRAVVNWLARIEDALLKDMDSVTTANPDAMAEARKLTKRLYDNFRRGKMGQVLGYSERSTLEVHARDTMDRIFAGKQAARDIEQMMTAAPETRDDAIDYIRALFMRGATSEGKVNATAARRLINQFDKKRIFEMFPELKDEFTDAVNKNVLAKDYAVPGEVIGTNKKSLAALFLEKGSGEETTILLKSRNPIQRARQLLTRMSGNTDAEEGLRQSFRQTMWEAGKVTKEGVKVPGAARFTEVVNNHVETMRALKFTEEQISNMQRLAKFMREAEAKPKFADRGEDTMTDIPGQIMRRLSNVLGARMANWVNRLTGGSGAGPGLQAAQQGSAVAGQVASAVRIDPAEQLLIAAMDDPVLMKALLIRDSASKAAKDKAAGRLNAWAASVGIINAEEEESSP
jgi:hypothetical protein